MLHRALALLLLPALLAAQDAPPRRAHHAMVYDQLAERVLLAGGSSPHSDGGCCAFFNDLWSFDGSRWTALPSSGIPMSGMALAYDSRANRVVSFGGYANGRSLPDVRALDRNTWMDLGRHPELAATEAGFVYDSRTNRFVAFGGSAGGAQANATWEYDGSTWTRVATDGPTARQAFVMVFDERRGRTVLFGGSGISTPPTPGPVFDDVWEFDGQRWMRIDAPNGPSARFAAGATYDSKRGLVIVFGGLNRSGAMADTWAWDGRAWTRLADASPTGPEARAMGYIAYDRKRDRVVLFGGRKGWPNDLNDTWEWDGASWKRAAN